MEMTIALLKNGLLESIRCYGPMESWVDYKDFFTNNVVAASEHMKIQNLSIFVVLTQDDVPIHVDHFENERRSNIL